METYNNPQLSEKRPVFLTVLCILTLVSCGFSFFGLLINLMQGPASIEALEAAETALLQVANDARAQNMGAAAEMMEKVAAFGFYTNEKFYTVLSMNALSTGLGLGGAILMLRRRKIGFHSYILYNIVAIVTIYMAVPVKEVPAILTIVNVIISAIFIFMYSRNLKWLR